MSAAAVKWALAQSVRGAEKSVLSALARHHSPRWGTVRATQDEIAGDVGLARETVGRVIKRLAAKGLLHVVPVPGKAGQWDANTYLLNPDGGGIAQPKRAPHRVTQDHTAPCDAHQTRHRVTQDHTTRENGYARAHSYPIQPGAEVPSQECESHRLRLITGGRAHGL